MPGLEVLAYGRKADLNAQYNSNKWCCIMNDSCT